VRDGAVERQRGDRPSSLEDVVLLDWERGMTIHKLRGALQQRVPCERLQLGQKIPTTAGERLITTSRAERGGGDVRGCESGGLKAKNKGHPGPSWFFFNQDTSWVSEVWEVLM